MVIKDMASIFGTNIAMLAGVKDCFDYSTGEKGKRIGSAYKVLNCENGTIETVKLADEEPVVTQDEIDAANAVFEPLLITFEGFEAKVYSTRDSNALRFSCSATRAELVDREVAI